jgi:SAM-dependent methyltransferase
MPSTPAVTLSQFDLGIRPCPLCLGKDFTRLAYHDRNLLGVITAGCKRCGLVQTNPRPSADGLNRFYRDHYRMFYQGASAPDREYIENLNKDQRLAYTARFFAEDLNLAPNATVLDFGCGEGSLFAALRKAGFTGAFYGVELNAAFGEFASRYGNATVSNTISAREPVDLIIVNHVLEHLADPIGTLRDLRSLLKPGGRIYIDVPDVECYSSIQDLHIAHIYHFSVRTLPLLVSRAGFLVESTQRHRPPHHPASVRLVACSASESNNVLALGPASDESQAWAATRHSGSFAGTVRLRLRQIPILRRLYRAFHHSPQA